MFDAISSALSNSIDIYLKLKSSEVRRQKLGRKLFALYTNLDQLGRVIDEIGTTIKVIADPDARPTLTWFPEDPEPGSIRPPEYFSLLTMGTGGFSIEIRSLGEDGTEQVVRRDHVKERDLLPILLSGSIRRLNKVIDRLVPLLQEDADEFWWYDSGMEPKLLRQLGAFDPDLPRLVADVWWTEGFFARVSYHIGLHQELGRNAIRLMDAEFSPHRRGLGRPYSDNIYEKEYLLSSPADANDLIAKIDRAAASVTEARDAVRAFITKNLTITDIM